ncbi:MAG: phosphoenolpyruvate--protein phosphotransferase [Clostridia bacterium]|nr:phosphoenolpyruvate--protein phosphotransferase [Clostridia bacterium]
MKIYKGIGASQGIAHAKVLYYKKKTGGKHLGIKEAFEKALERVRILQEKARADAGEDEAKIFAAYEMLLSDSMLTEPINAAIESGEDEEKAIKTVTESAAAVLASKKNEYMRRRAEDIRYIGQLLCDMLSGGDEFELPPGDDRFIIAAHELTPVDTMRFPKERLAGLVCEMGGATSHTAILAKSLGIPAIVGSEKIGQSDSLSDAFIDGYEGVLIVSPDDEKLREYTAKLNEENEFVSKLDKLKKEDAKTADGERIKLCINIGKPADMKGSENERFDGVGLFRTEFLYSSSDKKPTEEEQAKAYGEVLKACESVTIRTIDVGGDKQLSYMETKPEDNPFLGNRGIRLCLTHEDVFEEQLRAILIGAAGKKVKIMLPMVSSVSEISRAKDILARAAEKLKAEGADICSEVSVGIMIETPASAVMADVFAKHADFFSIGTNDLVQYTMAADRGNSEVEHLYNPFHPGVVRLLANVIRCGNDAGIEVSVCGDLAANTDFTELLLGLGLKKFSVPLPLLGRIKYKIGSIKLSDAEETAKRALEADDEYEVERILKGGK